jgi:hypothetical protein
VLKSCAPAREECNKYDLTGAAPCVYDWHIIMIGPGGLLSVISHLFAAPVEFSGWALGYRKVNN